MAETHDKYITLIADASMEPYRRVKYDGSTIATVTYADAADGDSWIGVTLPGPDGDAVAADGQVNVQLRGENNTIKVECSAAVTRNASIYPENDGKVSDDAGSVVIGTAAGTSLGAGSGAIIEMHPNAGSGSVPHEEAIANMDATTQAAIPILLKVKGVTASGNTEIKQPPRKLLPVKAWAVLREATTATNVKLVNATTDICAAVVHDTLDENQDFMLDDAHLDLEAAGTLYVNLATTCTAPGIDAFVLCIPIA